MKAKRQAGRINQKRRTRATLVAAAVELVEAGAVPTIPEVADHAGISRATAYRYFSSQERLLIEAMLERAMPGIDALTARWDARDDATARLGQLIEAVLAIVIEHEATFRAMLRASLDPAIDESQARGGRRLLWIERALEPVRQDLGPTAFGQLVATLTPFLGIEALVALCDVAGLDRPQAVRASRAAAIDLLHATLAGRSEGPAGPAR